LKVFGPIKEGDIAKRFPCKNFQSLRTDLQNFLPLKLYGTDEVAFQSSIFGVVVGGCKYILIRKFCH
jgi:hypothetical protein